MSPLLGALAVLAIVVYTGGLGAVVVALIVAGDRRAARRERQLAADPRAHR